MQHSAQSQAYYCTLSSQMTDTISSSKGKDKTTQSLQWLLKNSTKHYLTELSSYKSSCHIESILFTHLLGRFCLFFVRLFLVGLGRILLY